MSQADVDAFNRCGTINGIISISLQNSTSIFSMDNIEHITGNLKMVLFYSTAIVDMLTVAMKSLVSVGVDIRITYGQSLRSLSLPSLQPMAATLALADFPTSPPSASPASPASEAKNSALFPNSPL